MAKALEEQQGLPDCDRLSFDERLAMLVDREAVERDNAALAQRLRLARLRQAACLEDVDYRTPRGLDRSLIHSLASGRAVFTLHCTEHTSPSRPSERSLPHFLARSGNLPALRSSR
jgi:hypothetical protein